MAEIKLTSENFEAEVLNSDKPVMVDFWAEWCGPCKMLSPIISELAEEYDGKVKVGKVNVDEEMDLAMKYKVASIPTVVLFDKGEKKTQSIGYVAKEELVNMLG